MTTKILACGDLHLRSTRPKMRTDDFLQTQERKLDFIIETANDEACDFIIFPGDVFHRHDASHGLVEWAIRRFRQFEGECLFVYGQHDLRYHTGDKLNTPLGVLIASLGRKAVILNNEEPYNAYSKNAAEDYLLFWGCSWGDKLPKPVDAGVYEFLVLHRPVTVDPLPWEHDDLITAKELAKAFPASFIISGDNHTQFTFRSKGTEVLNMGSVMRTASNQINHNPALALITLNGEASTWDRIAIPIRKGVFDVEEMEAQKVVEDRRNERLEKLTETLAKSFDAGLSFVDNLRLASEKADAGVRDLIAEVLAGNV